MQLSDFLTSDKPPEAATSLDAEFQRQLFAMLQAAPNRSLSIYSGYRSPERQAQLWEGALRKYGSPALARKWVAPPGKSFHNRGLAADLRFADASAIEWAHEHAADYGLKFPLSNENWHIEPANNRVAHAASTSLAGSPQAPDVRGVDQPTGDVATYRSVASPAGLTSLPNSLETRLQSIQQMNALFDPNPEVRNATKSELSTGEQALADWANGISPFRRMFFSGLAGLLHA